MIYDVRVRTAHEGVKERGENSCISAMLLLLNKVMMQKSNSLFCNLARTQVAFFLGGGGEERRGEEGVGRQCNGDLTPFTPQGHGGGGGG